MDWLKSVIHKIKKFALLEGYLKLLLLQLLWFFPLIAIGLNLFGLNRIQWLLTKILSVSNIKSTDIKNQRQIIIKTNHMIKIAVSFYKPWSTCLNRSLTLWFLLANQGIDTELKIGVKFEEDNFSAHAWIEYKGYILNDSSNVNTKYTAFDSLSEVNNIFNNKIKNINLID